ncbi:hypothetical protein MASR2M16_25200 [Thauera terpenica]
MLQRAGAGAQRRQAAARHRQREQAYIRGMAQGIARALFAETVRAERGRAQKQGIGHHPKGKQIGQEREDRKLSHRTMKRRWTDAGW